LCPGAARGTSLANSNCSVPENTYSQSGQQFDQHAAGASDHPGTHVVDISNKKARDLVRIQMRGLVFRNRRLNDGDRSLYAVLDEFANGVTGISWRAQTTLARELGVCRQEVCERVAQLREAGYLTTRKTRDRFLYYLAWGAAAEGNRYYLAWRAAQKSNRSRLSSNGDNRLSSNGDREPDHHQNQRNEKAAFRKSSGVAPQSDNTERHERPWPKGSDDQKPRGASPPHPRKPVQEATRPCPSVSASAKILIAPNEDSPTPDKG
jgi:hypothetical protein